MIDGMARGSTTLVMVWKRLAPSRVAASSMVAGMVSK